MMDNLRLPFMPLPLVRNHEGQIKDASDWEGTNVGFSKIEMASLMIATNLVEAQDWNMCKNEDSDKVFLLLAKTAVAVAKAVIVEANKMEYIK